MIETAVVARPSAPKMKITLSLVKRSSTCYLQATHVPAVKRRAARYGLVTVWVTRSGGLPRRSRSLHADLRHAPTIDARDLEAVALDLDRVADLRNATQSTEDHAAD